MTASPLSWPVNIGTAARLSGVSAKMVRHYEALGLLPTVGRTDSGYRQYSEAEIHTLRFIKRSRELGFSIERIRTLLALWSDRRRKSSDVKKLARQYIRELETDIEKLQSIRDELQHLAECCRGDQRPECPILDELAKAHHRR